MSTIVTNAVAINVLIIIMFCAVIYFFVLIFVLSFPFLFLILILPNCYIFYLSCYPHPLYLQYHQIYGHHQKLEGFHQLYHYCKINHQGQWQRRSSPPEVFCKKGDPRNFVKLTGKSLCQSLFFNKVAGLRPATLLKKTLWQRCFLVDFAKFLRTLFTEHLGWLLLVQELCNSKD